MNFSKHTNDADGFHDPKVEELLRKKEIELKEMARKNARQFALRNLPARSGGDLTHFTGQQKALCEKTAADAFQILQPRAQFPEAKIESDFLKEEEKTLSAEITYKNNQNLQDEHTLDDYNPGSLALRIGIVAVITSLICIGDTTFLTKSMQVIGDNFLFSLILSACISFAIFVFSHIAPFWYKGAATPFKRRAVLLGSLSLVTALFTALAVFRSLYLAAHDIYINPVYFVLINLFFFIVSASVSFFILPTWTEMKQNFPMLKLYRAVQKRNREIERLKKKKEKINIIVMERTKFRVRIAHYSNYTAERIRTMYRESIEIFKTMNLIFRSDGICPDCFSQELPDLDIDDFTFTIVSEP